MASIGEVFLSLGFDVDETSIKGFSDKISDLQKSMLKLTGIAGGTIYGLMRFASGTTESATALENLKDLTGENTEAVLKWMTVANAANTSISFDAVRESIQSVNQALSDAALGANRNIYLLLGVDWQKDGKIRKGTDFLNEIRENWDSIVKRYQPFGGIPKLMADLSNIGISRGMQQALMLSNKEFESLSGNYKLAQEAIEKNKKLGQTINDLQVQIKQIKDTFISDYAPAITTTLQGVIPFVDNLKKGIIEMKPLVIALGVAFAGLSLAFSPLTALATALAALAYWFEKIGEKGSFKKWFQDFSAENKKLRPWDERYQNEILSQRIDQSMKEQNQIKGLNQTNNTNFNIYGANDPQLVGEYIKSQLDTEKRNTWVQLNNGALK